MPMKPSSASLSTFSWGNSQVSSYLLALGANSFSASSRAVSRIIRSSSVSSKCTSLPFVCVKAATGFPAKMPRPHHLSEQRTGAVLIIAKAVMEDFHDAETRVESDQIGQSQGSHGMVHAQLHYRIDRFRF